MNSHIVVAVVALAVGIAIGVTAGIAVGVRIAFKAVRQPPTPLPALFCAIGAGALFLTALGTGAHSMYFLLASDHGTATVTEIREQRDAEGDLRRGVVYQYRDAAGREHRDTTSFSAGREFAVGDMVPIRYLRSAPAESRIDYFSYHWFLPMFLAAGAAIAAAFGAALYWNYTRQTRTAPDGLSKRRSNQPTAA